MTAVNTRVPTISCLLTVSKLSVALIVWIDTPFQLIALVIHSERLTDLAANIKDH